MADVKWIKLMTDVFDDEKILLIESLPEKDSLIVIWFKLLCLAGKQNNSGVFVFSNRMPYTDEMFATIFRRPINTVRLALATFQQYGMIDIVDNVVTIPNWNKHQNLDAYEKKKARDRLYQAERRAAQKALIEKSSDKSSDIAVSDIDIEEDKEKEEDKNILSSPKKPTKHKYGEYNNVLLTDAELEKIKAEYPDYEERIERLSSYVASTGKSYKSHYATIRNWARKDTPKPQKKAEEPEFLKKWSV